MTTIFVHITQVMDIRIWTQLDPERTINWVQKDITRPQTTFM